MMVPFAETEKGRSPDLEEIMDLMGYVKIGEFVAQ